MFKHTPWAKGPANSPKGMMHFFWTGVMLKFANWPIRCANVNILHRGYDGFLPYMVGSEKGPPKQQKKG